MHQIVPNLACLFVLVAVLQLNAKEKPNIVVIMCDDLGYGDVHCLAPQTSKIPTPNSDQLASQGMVFSDAHSGSSVCTPTRYGLMTGRYSWRTRLQKGVVQGFAPSLISEGRPTIASFLKSHGYTTGVIGKWHLDQLYLDPDTGRRLSRQNYKLPPIGARIPDGPVHRGFEYFHGFHHAGNMKAVIENDRVVEHDNVINMLPRLARESVEFIARQKGKENPFLLYLPLNSPHTPIVPAADWQGKSGFGEYADFVMQTDNVVGEIANALKRYGFTNNTLVILTSDNGCSKAAGIPELARLGHHVSANFRGSKADIWDGGHRIPFIVSWPGRVKPGTTSNELICLTDLFATVAEIAGHEIPTGSCEDSVSFLPALEGRRIESSRKGVIHHSISGHFAYRNGRWKLVLARGSGGWSSPTERQVPAGGSKAQLYDMKTDPGEQNNLYEKQPRVAKRLLDQLTADVFAGRSTPGPDSSNDIEDIVLWKSEHMKNNESRSKHP